MPYVTRRSHEAPGSRVAAVPGGSTGRRDLALVMALVLALLAALALAACGAPDDASPAGNKPSTGNASPAAAGGESVRLLNVSYDPTRELYRELNEAFARHWKETTGQTVTIQQSHGGSGSQSRAVIDGLEADVVTLAMALDVDAIAEEAGLIKADWQGTLPHNNAPYTSTLVFLVREGNPKNIRNWGDLARPGIQVITPNPKTSGAARWNYLAMWGFALRRELGEDWIDELADPAQADAVGAANDVAREFVAAIYRNVPVLDRAAREATNTFIQRRIGDVLVNWENEALLGAGELDAAGLQVVVPPMSMLAEPVVAMVDRNVDRNGTREVATAYLEYLYSEVGQDIAGRNYYRPVASKKAQAKYREQFPQVELFTIREVFGGWQAANEAHFADGASFDQIYRPR